MPRTDGRWYGLDLADPILVPRPAACPADKRWEKATVVELTHDNNAVIVCYEDGSTGKEVAEWCRFQQPLATVVAVQAFCAASWAVEKAIGDPAADQRTRQWLGDRMRRERDQLVRVLIEQPLPLVEVWSEVHDAMLYLDRDARGCQPVDGPDDPLILTIAAAARTMLLPDAAHGYAAAFEHARGGGGLSDGERAQRWSDTDEPKWILYNVWRPLASMPMAEVGRLMTVDGLRATVRCAEDALRETRMTSERRDVLDRAVRLFGRCADLAADAETGPATPSP